MLQFLASHTVWVDPEKGPRAWAVGCPADARGELRLLGEVQGQAAGDHVACPYCALGLATVGQLGGQRDSGLVCA
jgi:hypothetical protein